MTPGNDFLIRPLYSGVFNSKNVFAKIRQEAHF